MNFFMKIHAKKYKRFSLLPICMHVNFFINRMYMRMWRSRYQTYIKSLIAINYLGATKDYIAASGANQEDADALYQANIDLLTDNILTYYSVNIDDAPEMREQFESLAKNIYSKVNYKG